MEYILGVVASVLIQAIKKYFGTDTFATHLVVLVSCFGFAASWVLLKDTAFWATFLQVLVTAGAVHTFIIRKFE